LSHPKSNERGVTHLDDLAAAMQRRDTAALAYFAFDILHLDGHDLRRCPLISRKAMLAELLRAAGGRGRPRRGVAETLRS
jgi:bifunctional non-homologous end joining protein LigD